MDRSSRHPGRIVAEDMFNAILEEYPKLDLKKFNSTSVNDFILEADSVKRGSVDKHDFIKGVLDGWYEIFILKADSNLYP